MNGEEFNMDEKNREEEKLTEAEVTPMTTQTDPTQVPPATPATPSEVAEAGANLDMPQVADQVTDGALVGEDAVVDPVEENPEEKGFVKANAEILIPADALNTAAAMETGDTGDAGMDTAPNAAAPTVEAPEGAVVTDVTGVTADEMQPAIQESTEDSKEDLNSIKESLTEDDLRMILEYRKYKESTEKLESEVMQESASEEDKTEEKLEEATVPEEGEDLEEREDPIEANFPDPEPLADDTTPVEEEPVEDAEEEAPTEALNFDDIEAADDVDIEGVFDDTELDPEDLEALLGDEDAIDPDDLEDFLGDEVAVEDIPDALRTSADFLDYVLSDRDDEEEQEDEDALDFDAITEGEPEAEEEEVEEDDEEDLMESLKNSRTQRTLNEDYVGYSHRFNEASENNGIWYPPTSEPGAEQNSEIARAKEATEKDIIQEYQDHMKEQKQAISNFRNKIKENKNRNAAASRKEVESESKFNEALRGTSKASRINENSNSWANNTFIEKYNESQKLDFKKLLEDGFLG